MTDRTLADFPVMLTAQEAAKIARCSRNTILNAIRRGLLPSRRRQPGPGASPHLITREDLMQWLLGSKEEA
jgi:excisionase family DNA binding protein